jgi:uncharacterized protein
MTGPDGGSGGLDEPIVSCDLSISGVATSIAAFVGWSPQGPVGAAQLVLSWSDFVRVFGGLDARSFLGYAVSHFFANGGSQAYVIRVASAEEGTVLTPATASSSAAGAFEAAIIPGSAGGVDLLECVDIFNMLCVPGEADPATLHSLAAFCRDHRAMLIADCYQDSTFFSASSGPPTILSSKDIAENAAYYFPWIIVPDPLRSNLPGLFPPSGFAAGIWARTDANEGVWKQPAGRGAGLSGASGVSVPLGDREIGVLNPLAVNCIRDLSGVGTVLWGARTLAGIDQAGSEWKFISVRRLALFIEQSLQRGLAWVVFEPNDESLWGKVRLHVGVFLENLFRDGAFQGQTSQEAFFVKCGRDTMTQNDIDQGRLVVVVGIAPVAPAEFVIIQIGQFVGQ